MQSELFALNPVVTDCLGRGLLPDIMFWDDVDMHGQLLENIPTFLKCNHKIIKTCISNKTCRHFKGTVLPKIFSIILMSFETIFFFLLWNNRSRDTNNPFVWVNYSMNNFFLWNLGINLYVCQFLATFTHYNLRGQTFFFFLLGIVVWQ